jgi:leucyl-tRNA synthetase
VEERYDPKSIEPKWQSRWAPEGLFRLKGARSTLETHGVDP